MSASITVNMTGEETFTPHFNVMQIPDGRWFVSLHFSPEATLIFPGFDQECYANLLKFEDVVEQMIIELRSKLRAEDMALVDAAVDRPAPAEEDELRMTIDGPSVELPWPSIPATEPEVPTSAASVQPPPEIGGYSPAPDVEMPDDPTGQGRF